MQYDNNNRRQRNIFIRIVTSQKTLAVLGLAMLILISLPLWKNIMQRRAIEKEIEEMEKEIGRVENKNNDLRKLIDYFKSDQFTEEQARLNFGLKKGGEQVAVIKDYPGTGLVGPSTSADGSQIFDIPGADFKEPVKIVTNFSKWRAYFFSN